MFLLCFLALLDLGRFCKSKSMDTSQEIALEPWYALAGANIIVPRVQRSATYAVMHVYGLTV